MEVKNGNKVFLVWYRSDIQDWKLLPHTGAYFRTAPNFSWGQDNLSARQLASVLLYAYLLKELKMQAGPETARKISSELAETFAMRHIISLQSGSWTLRAKTVATFLKSQNFKV